MSSSQPHRSAGASVKPLSPVAEWLYGHANRLLDLFGKWRAIVRRPFYNLIAWAAVAGGLLAVSGSVWPELFVKLAAEILKNGFSASFTSIATTLGRYEAKPEPLGVICGTVIVFMGLAYHWLSSKYDQVQRAHQYNEAMRRLDADRDHDKSILDKFAERYPHEKFSASLAGLLQNGVGIQQMNERYEFWRDPMTTFRAAEMESSRLRLCEAHKVLNETAQLKGDLKPALGELNETHSALIRSVETIYQAKAATVQELWRGK